MARLWRAKTSSIYIYIYTYIHTYRQASNKAIMDSMSNGLNSAASALKELQPKIREAAMEGEKATNDKKNADTLKAQAATEVAGAVSNEIVSAKALSDDKALVTAAHDKEQTATKAVSGLC